MKTTMRPSTLSISLMSLMLLLAACSANHGGYQPPTVSASSSSSGGTSSSSSSGGSSSSSGVTSKATPDVSMAVVPSQIDVGQSALLLVTTDNVTTCKTIGAWKDSVPVDNAGDDSTGILTNPGVYTYGLACTGPNGGTSQAVTLTVGTAPTPQVALNVTPTSMSPGGSATLTWSSVSATSCTASGGTGGDNWSGMQPLNDSAGFTTSPISTAGQYFYTLTCSGPGGSGSASQVLTVNAAAPPTPPTLTFTSNTNAATVGGTITLSWTSTNATSCAATGGTGADQWTATQPTQSTGLTIGPLAVAGTYTYSLTCQGGGGSMSQSVSVAVNATATPPVAPTVSISASPIVVTVGGSANLSWSTTGASTCSASGAWSGNEPLIGSASTGTISSPGSYDYELSCTGAGGDGQGAATVTAVEPPATITNFIATPSSVAVGGIVKLSWTSANASSCTPGGGTQSDGWTGVLATASGGFPTLALTAAGTYTYTLVCAGAGGSSAASSVTVVVAAPNSPAVIGNFQATPSTVQAGGFVDLSWGSGNATSCSAGNGTGSDGWTGSEPLASAATLVGPLNTVGNVTYSLTCTGNGGSSSPATVSVAVTAQPPAASLTAFTALPGEVQTGGSIVLSWASLNATSCTASGGSGGDGWTGTQPSSSIGVAIGPLNTAGNYTYLLSCSGPGGTSTNSSATVTVSAATPPATVSVFAALPADVQANGLVTLSWTSTNATSCTGTGGTGSDGWIGTQAASNVGLTLGPLAAGTYTYSLTCTGTGGTSTASTATVVVTAAPPVPTISAFSLLPLSIQIGSSITLSWNSANATSCTGTGGTGSDGWATTQAAANAGLTLGPITATGSLAYTLTCSGPGGTSQASTQTVLVVALPPVATLSSFAASPLTLQVGQSTTLSWTSANATGCTAGGGSGTAGWSGTLPASSTGTLVGPITTTGLLTFSLTCTGAGGTSAASTALVTATAPPPGPPTIAVSINGGTTGQIQPGQSFSLAWTTTNATACTASGGTGSDGWNGVQSLSNAGKAIGPISTPGVYSYGLNCIGAGGSGSGSATLTVIVSTSSQCGISEPSTLLLSPAANVSSDVDGICLLCGVANATNVIDSNTSNYATMVVTAGVTAIDELQVTDTAASFPAGRKAGFLVSDPGSLLSLSLLSSITIDTLQGSTVQESATAHDILNLEALGLFADPDEAYIYFKTTKPFNAVRIRSGALASLLSTFNVYGACVTLQ